MPGVTSLVPVLALMRLLDDLYDLALCYAGALDYRFSPLDPGETVQVVVAQTKRAVARISLPALAVAISFRKGESRFLIIRGTKDQADLVFAPHRGSQE
jgi:hypothetical protein